MRVAHNVAQPAAAVEAIRRIFGIFDNLVDEVAEMQNEAEAILIEARANAQAIEKRNEALAGAGGRTMVKLKIAEAMAGKRIVMLPSKGANIQTLDINQLVGNITAGKAGLSK